MANRMKKRGMSWTIKGAQRMARLITLREMGQLHSWITQKAKPGARPPPKREISQEPTPVEDGLKLLCLLYMAHIKTAPGFKFFGH